jgi:hypothetical protein
MHQSKRLSRAPFDLRQGDLSRFEQSITPMLHDPFLALGLLFFAAVMFYGISQFTMCLIRT